MQRVRVLQRVARVLRPGGYLFLAGAETMHGIDSGYERVQVGRGVCYRVATGRVLEGDGARPRHRGDARHPEDAVRPVHRSGGLSPGAGDSPVTALVHVQGAWDEAVMLQCPRVLATMLAAMMFEGGDEPDDGGVREVLLTALPGAAAEGP